MKKILFFTLPLITAVASAAPTNGQKFDSWTAICDKGQCAVRQVQNKNGNPFADAMFSKPKNAKGATVFNFTAPLGTHLLQGLDLSIDTKPLGKVPFMYCSPIGCHFNAPLEAGDLQKFKAGNRLQAVFYTMDGQKHSIQFSLKGITKAIDSL